MHRFLLCSPGRVFLAHAGADCKPEKLEAEPTDAKLDTDCRDRRQVWRQKSQMDFWRVPGSFGRPFSSTVLVRIEADVYKYMLCFSIF